jgi:uncharacterized membrane protein YfcA
VTLSQACALFFAAIFAGTLNSVAGGGSFFTFPALLLTGMPPINANATNTVALWPGSVASAGAYRGELTGQRRRLMVFGSVSVVGGILGAIVLLHTSQTLFLRMVPFLLLLATLVFAFGGSVTQWVRTQRAKRAEQVKESAGMTLISQVGTLFFQFLVAFYGGFFGGGIGILMLAMLSFLGIKNIHTMNALKTVLTACINGVAVVTFVLAGVVIWPQAVLMIVGAIAGGYSGAAYAQKVDPTLVRRAVIVIGFALSIYFFVHGGSAPAPPTHHR